MSLEMVEFVANDLSKGMDCVRSLLRRFGSHRRFGI